MNTVLAHCTRPGSFAKGPWVSVAAASLLLSAAIATPLAVQAQEVAAVMPSGGSQTMVGRVSAMPLSSQAAAPAPRFTVERYRMLESDRLNFGNNGADPSGRPIAEQGAVTARWWVGRGASNFGLGLGASGYYFPSQGGSSMDGPMAVKYTASVLTVGYRYQVDSRSTLFADASGARRFNADAVDQFSTKVGVEWKASSRKFGLDGAARSLSVQLDSGYKMAVKVRRNGIGVYVRGQF